MNKRSNTAFINATSVYTACGNTEETFNALFTKQSGLKAVSDYIVNKTVCIGKFPTSKNFEEILIACVEEIIVQIPDLDFSQTLLLVGSSVGGMANSEKTLFQEKSYKNIQIKKHPIEVIAATLDAKFNFYATRSFSTACTSSANALKTAKELIEIGAYDNILVIGADEICSTTVFGFDSLGILSDSICTPFQNERKGMNVAEGIGVLLLQNKALSNIALVGAGSSSDAHHIANPDPEAKGAIKAISDALLDASIEASQIDYVNAHGTGTQANDASEAKAVLNLFGETTFISSSKSTFGHTLGAAGAIEAIVCVEVLKRQYLAPQIFTQNTETDIAIVKDASSAKLHYVLSNSLAFGGNNTSLIFGVVHEN